VLYTIYHVRITIINPIQARIETRHEKSKFSQLSELPTTRRIMGWQKGNRQNVLSHKCWHGMYNTKINLNPNDKSSRQFFERRFMF